jgi:hypothetical protein
VVRKGEMHESFGDPDTPKAFKDFFTIVDFCQINNLCPLPPKFLSITKINFVVLESYFLY